MSGGLNGLTPIENLDQRRKCPVNPTKARFKQAAARREAKARAERTGLPIEPYLCEGCGFWHLTKSSRGSVTLRDGRYTSMRALAPTHPVFARGDALEDHGAPVPGNRLARMKVLRQWLEAEPEATPTSAEVIERLGGTLARDTLRSLMREAGYRNTGGRSARWVPEQRGASPEPPQEPPQAVGSVWSDVRTDDVDALTVAALRAAYRAVGLSLRIQVSPVDD